MSFYELPRRVTAALEYVEKCQQVTEPCGWVRPGRDLTPHEARVLAAALEVLRLYFSGEMDYRDDDKEPDEPEAKAQPATLPPAI